MKANQARCDLLRACREEFVPPRCDPPFDFEIGMSSSFSDLLSGTYKERSRDLGEIARVARFRGRLLISAPAGSGKTSFALRLMGHMLENDVPALRVDLRRWTPSIDAEWRRSAGADARQASVLLRQLAKPAIAERELRAAGEGDSILLVVDGLNEVPTATAAEIPRVLDSLAARTPSLVVVLCDRLVRRPQASDDWLLATISEVKAPDSGALEIDNALLLDIARDRPETKGTEAEIILWYLCRAASIDSPDQDRLADAALRLYEEEGGRYFAWDRLVSVTGRDVPERLVKAGALNREDGSAYFRHHLFHDALAAYRVVETEDRWTTSCFDTLTFNANSFDALGLGLELLDEPERADRFLLSIYDWNLYGAAYALARGMRLGGVVVKRATEEAMLAVLAERRWDPIAPSAQRVEDALRVFKTSLAQRYLQARDLKEVFSIVLEGSDDTSPEPWRALFLGEADVADLLGKLDGGPLNGWIAANALRRADLDEQDIHAVAWNLSAGPDIVRWRAAHVLGAHASKWSVNWLFTALDGDAWKWVRYGSIRALVEIAGASESFRQEIVAGIVDRIDELRQEPLVMGELEKSLQLREPPLGWASAVEPLLERLFETASTVPAQDHWRAVGHRVEESIRSARAAHA